MLLAVNKRGKTFLTVMLLPFLFCCNPVLAESSWSAIKTLSINHVGDPRNNDGFHPEALGLSYAINDSHALKLGFFENSQKRDSVLVGYSYTYRDTPRF